MMSPPRFATKHILLPPLNKAGFHPSINHGPWTDEEAASLKALLGDTAEGEIDWVEVAEDLGVGR
jgi:hypothetical protein